MITAQQRNRHEAAKEVVPMPMRPHQPMGAVKSVAGAIAATGMLMTPALMLRAMDRPSIIPRLWHRAVTRSLGVRVSVRGTPESGAVLYVVNHLSWLDIPVLGSHLEGSFVAKSEVGSMGFVGSLANLQGTIYVNRSDRRGAATQAEEIRSRLLGGDNIILFPEGTSNDGTHILPFKSALFMLLEDDGADQIRIQPVTLAYTRLNGLPLNRHRLLDIAWIGDMELGGHAIDLMRMGRIDAEILCHQPVRRQSFPDRKALAGHCRKIIIEGYRHLMRKDRRVEAQDMRNGA